MAKQQQFFVPAIHPSVPWETRQHIQLLYQKVNNIVTALGMVKQGTSTTSTTIESGGTSGGGSGGGGTTTPFGTVNNQSGIASYTTVGADNGAVVIFSDAAPVAVSLYGATPPYSMAIVNQGTGLATLTPTGPSPTSTISYYGNPAASSMPLAGGQWCVVAYDGANWWAAIEQLPVTFNAILHEWLNSYNAATGLFTATQPAFTDISGTINPATQMPASGVTAGSYIAANITVNAEGLITAAASSGAGVIQVNAYVAKTANYTIDPATDYQVDCTSGSFTVTLPTAAGITGQSFSTKNSGAGTITLATTGGQTIDGAATQSLAPLNNIRVLSNGANWIII